MMTQLREIQVQNIKKMVWLTHLIDQGLWSSDVVLSKDGHEGLALFGNRLVSRLSHANT